MMYNFKFTALILNHYWLTAPLDRAWLREHFPTLAEYLPC